MTSISNRMTGITDSRSSNSMTGKSDSWSSNSMSNSRSMSISVSNWCSNSGSSNSRSMSISNWCSNSMNSWLVDSDMVLVDHRGFYNMLDWVDFVGFGYSIGLGYFNSVRFCNMFFNNDFSLNRNGDSNWNLNFVFVDLDFRFDSGYLRGDTSVGADRSSNFGDSYGISRGRALVGGCWGNSSIRCWGCGDCRRGNWDSGLRGFWWTSNIGVSWGLGHRFFLSIGVAHLDGLRSNLNGTVSNNFLVSLVNRGSGNNMFMDLSSHNSWGSDVSMTKMTQMAKMTISQWGRYSYRS
jgi:hypothetical protein